MFYNRGSGNMWHNLSLVSPIFCTVGFTHTWLYLLHIPYSSNLCSISVIIKYQRRSGISRLLREEDASENPAFLVSFLLPFPVNGEWRKKRVNKWNRVTFTTKGTPDDSFFLLAFPHRKSWKSRHFLFFSLVNILPVHNFVTCPIILPRTKISTRYISFYHQQYNEKICEGKPSIKLRKLY